MADEGESYQEIVECDAPEGEGVIFIKVVALPFQGAVEFDTKQARAFARRILSAVDVVEKQWAEWDAAQRAQLKEWEPPEETLPPDNA